MSVVTIVLSVAPVTLVVIAGILAFPYLKNWRSIRNAKRLQKMKEQIRRQVRAELVEEMDTAELPVWDRHSSPLEISNTLEQRIVRRSSGGENKHYPFLLPDLDPVTPLPDVMREAPVISKVVMRANDWVECRDQFGFRMNEYSGLCSNVQLKIMANFNGDWLVPHSTGFNKVIRFKRVRPQDFQVPPLRNPRDLPEVKAPQSPEEYSPIV